MSDLGGTIISLCLGAVMLWCLLKYAPIEIKLRLKGRPFLCVVVWLCLSVGVLMGGGKCFQFVPPMTDRESQSTAEGNSVLVQWDTDKLPSDASVFIYRQEGTNEPVEVATSNVGQGWYRFTQPNATNYKYIVWTDYIPPPIEVTNEVYVLYGIVTNGVPTKYIPGKFGIRENGTLLNLK